MDIFNRQRRKQSTKVIFSPTAGDRAKRFLKWGRSSIEDLKKIVAEHYDKMNGSVQVQHCPAGVPCANFIPSWMHDPAKIITPEPKPDPESANYLPGQSKLTNIQHTRHKQREFDATRNKRRRETRAKIKAKTKHVKLSCKKRTKLFPKPKKRSLLRVRLIACHP